MVRLTYQNEVRNILALLLSSFTKSKIFAFAREIAVLKAKYYSVQGGSPNLGKPSAEGYLSDRDGPNVQRQLRAISEGNVGYCGVRFNWPRKLGTIV